MTNQDAIAKALAVIKAKTGTIPVYPYEAPKTSAMTERIVVNTLGMPSDVFQIGIMNVNTHVPDVAGLINMKRIYELAVLVRSGFATYEATLPDRTAKIFFREENEMMIQSEGEHLLNIRYKVFMLN